MMNSEKACLYHDNKLCFQQLSRDIQHSKLIPRPYVYRLAMAVCSCRRQKPNLQSLLQASDLNKIILFIQDQLQHRQSHLKSFLNSELQKGISLDKYSLCMLLYVINQSYQNRSYEFLQGRGPGMEKPKNVNVQKPNKQKVCEMAVKKTLKKLKSKAESTIPIFPGNLMQLRETDCFKKLIFEHRRHIVLMFNKVANQRTYADKKASSHVIIHYSDPGTLSTFKSRLWSAAVEIQAAVDKKRLCFITCQCTIVLACAVKETRQKDFTLKLKKRKCSQTSPSPLIEGQCYNCQGPFEGLKHSDSCKHHPGFIRDAVWTCCGEEAKKTKAFHQTHQETG
ncbi:uncharacterized protein [Argopecten irradians]|uniref:uncharacterized protein n=1 Tax=Argopecten irradians TaxID=31199 RepID=UPI00371C6EDE